MTWQPIETAPRDGTAFLGWRPHARQYFARQDCDIVHYSEWGPGVWEGSSGHAKYDLAEITHWMPLPDVPATAL